MEKRVISTLHPDLVVDKESAIDRMGATASVSAAQERPNFTKQIQLVRRVARGLCQAYENCRQEDWCWHCRSGQEGQPLRLGVTCLGCKLLTTDARITNKHLIQIQLLESHSE